MAYKKSFYSYCRYLDKVDGKIKEGFIRRQGFGVKNDYGLSLSVYMATDATAATNWHERKTWFVVDEYCGLSVASGDTRKEAEAKALEVLSKVDMESYRNKAIDFVLKHGPVPGHEITYLHQE